MYSTFEDSTNKALDIMEERYTPEQRKAITDRIKMKIVFPELEFKNVVLNPGEPAKPGTWVMTSAGIKTAEEYNMSNQFDFGQMLIHVKAGKKCRRASWDAGKYIYRAADDSSTLRRRDSTSPETLSTIYHGTNEMFATDWELVIETCSLGEAIEHLRSGGTVRRLGWVDHTGRTYLKAYGNEVFIHFPGGTKDAWKPYSREVLATDWIKIPAP